MIKLDDNLLTELGLQALPAEDKKALLRHIYETLEMRVGTTLARQMTDGQLDEFEAFINSNDEAGALRWLETNFPNYKDVVAQEFEVLKAEVRQSAPQILAGANATASGPQQPQQIAADVPLQQPMTQQPMQQIDTAMPQPQQYQQYHQQPAYGAPTAPQTQPAMPQSQPMQQEYVQPQQYQQPQPMPQYDPMAAPQPQQQPTYAPQYPQPVTPQQYQQPQQPMQQMQNPGGVPPQAQQSAPTQPFDQNQFGQAA